VQNLNKGKKMLDQFKSKGIETYLMSEYGRYFDDDGVKVSLDTGGKSCKIEGKLLGEDKPVCVEVGKYEVVSQDKDRFLKIIEVNADRMWLNTALAEFLKGKSFKIPLFVAAAL